MYEREKMFRKSGCWLCIFVVVMLFLGGCARYKDSSLKEEKKLPDEDYEMTDEEKQFLKGIYIDEERIEKGLLYSYQKKMLMHYRFALQYLNEKYPSYSFKIESGTPINKVNTYATFHFREESMDDWFVLLLYEEEELICVDNFYGYIIREAYDDYIYSQCIDSIPSLLGTYSDISCARGIEYDENMTVEEIINGDKPLYPWSPMTKIYLAGDHISEDVWEQTVETVEKTIKDLGLYGSFIIYYLYNASISEFDAAKYYHNLEAEVLYDCNFQNFAPVTGSEGESRKNE